MNMNINFKISEGKHKIARTNPIAKPADDQSDPRDPHLSYSLFHTSFSSLSQAQLFQWTAAYHIIKGYKTIAH